MAGLAAEERAWLAEALRKEESPAGAEAREMLAVEQGEFEARYAGVLNAAACDEESKALANDPEADPAPSRTARWRHIARRRVATTRPGSAAAATAADPENFSRLSPPTPPPGCLRPGSRRCG